MRTAIIAALAVGLLATVTVQGTAPVPDPCLGSLFVAEDAQPSMRTPGATFAAYPSRDAYEENTGAMTCTAPPVGRVEPAVLGYVADLLGRDLPGLDALSSRCDILGNCNTAAAASRHDDAPLAHGPYTYCAGAWTSEPPAGTPCNYWGEIWGSISSKTAISGTEVLEGSPGMYDTCSFSQPATNSCTTHDTSIDFPWNKGSLAACVKATSTAHFTVTGYDENGNPILGSVVTATARCN